VRATSCHCATQESDKTAQAGKRLHTVYKNTGKKPQPHSVMLGKKEVLAFESGTKVTYHEEFDPLTYHSGELSASELKLLLKKVKGAKSNAHSA
jgi:hypothetical protein